MAKPKFASLTAGLLARKGEAHPAAETFAAMAAVSSPTAAGVGLVRDPLSYKKAPELSLQDELEWMTTVAPASEGPVHSQDSETDDAVPPSARIVERPRIRTLFAMEPPAANIEALLKRIAKSPKNHPGPSEIPATSGRRVAVTVRLDEAGYLRLKLAGLRYHRTSQNIIMKALEAYLTALGVEPVDDGDFASFKFSLPKRPD